MPTMERRRRTRKGFFPPVVSTQAEKGIRSRDPERDGAATRKPTSRGPRPMIPLRLFAVGPNRETAANPMKNPRVAPVNPWTGVPMVPKPTFDSTFIWVSSPTSGPEASYDCSGSDAQGTKEEAGCRPQVFEGRNQQKGSIVQGTGPRAGGRRFGLVQPPDGGNDD